MKKKMLVICNQMQLGGVCIAAKNFIDNMHEDYDIEFMLAKPGGELLNRLPADVKITNMPYPICCSSMTKNESKAISKKYFIRKCLTTLMAKSKIVSTPIIGKKLAKKVKQTGENYYDIVINNDMDMSPTFVGSCHAYCKHLVKSPTKCLIVHGDFVANNYDKNFFEKEYLSDYNYVILLSEALKRQMEEIFPQYKDKFIAIPNFQAVKEIKELSLAEDIKFNKSVLNIVSASRLTEVKGIMRSLGVLKKLRGEGYKFCWHILGEGEQRKEIEEFIKQNGMLDCVKLYGAMKNPYPYMKSADLFYLGSYHEAAPMVIGEANILGIPVLTTKTISSNCMVDDNYGWVCENTENGIYEGFKEIFDNADDLKHKTAMLVNYNFDNESLKKKYNELLNKV